MSKTLEELNDLFINVFEDAIAVAREQALIPSFVAHKKASRINKYQRLERKRKQKR